MDKTFLVIYRLAEKARVSNDLGSELFFQRKLLRYGIANGFLKTADEDDEKESEESVLLRADASASLLRDFRDEEVGSVLNMTHEERLALINRTEDLAKEVEPVLEALAKDSSLPGPKKEPLLV